MYGPSVECSVLERTEFDNQCKGVVNDAMGPVIGASVVEKGNATNGTITDIDGNFSLKVPSDATLTISFIGYKTVELPVAGKHPLL